MSTIVLYPESLESSPHLLTLCNKITIFFPSTPCSLKYVLSRVLMTRMGIGLVIGFINNPQVVTTINSYMVTDLHTLKSLHTTLLSPSAIVFTYLQHGSYTSLTKSHTPNITALQHTIFYFTCTIFTGQPPVFTCAPGFSLLHQLTTSRGYLLIAHSP
jgi:hypothetical protein